MTSLLDRAHLAQYTDGDVELEHELLGLLEQQIDVCVESLRSAKDQQSWITASHTLKGAARGVGAMALGEVCARAEASPLTAELLDTVAETAQATLQAIATVKAER